MKDDNNFEPRFVTKIGGKKNPNDLKDAEMINKCALEVKKIILTQAMPKVVFREIEDGGFWFEDIEDFIDMQNIKKYWAYMPKQIGLYWYKCPPDFNGFVYSALGYERWRCKYNMSELAEFFDINDNYFQKRLCDIVKEVGRAEDDTIDFARSIERGIDLAYYAIRTGDKYATTERSKLYPDELWVRNAVMKQYINNKSKGQTKVKGLYH